MNWKQENQLSIQIGQVIKIKIKKTTSEKFDKTIAKGKT